MRTDRVVVARVRRAAEADGAAESGLSALLGAHALHSAGDALITVALAGTVFFSVPIGQARGRVGLYLLLTLLPFSLLVPVAGPLLDRVPHGRRNVLAATTVGRGLLAWSMAGLLTTLTLYPLALAVLVLSRAYGLARSAAMPRVKPDGISLVTANARLNIAAVTAAAVAAAVGAGVSTLLGAAWTLRLATLVLLAGSFYALRLPAQIDEPRVPRVPGRTRYRLLSGPTSVLQPLVGAASLRGLAGLLTIFLAFDLRAHHVQPRIVGIVLGAAFLGQLIGTVAASRLPDRVVRRLTLASLVLPALACLAAAVFEGPVTAALAAGLAGMAYSLSKFTLDASLQTHVPAASVSGAFARSETGLQLSWAVGGGIAVALPSITAVGFAVGVAVPVLGIVATERVRRGMSVLPGAPARRPEPEPGVAPEPPGAPAGRDRLPEPAPPPERDPLPEHLRRPEPSPWWLEPDS